MKLKLSSHQYVLLPFPDASSWDESAPLKSVYWILASEYMVGDNVVMGLDYCQGVETNVVSYDYLIWFCACAYCCEMASRWVQKHHLRRYLHLSHLLA